jgi:carboxypeptidase C (cathepsin A)
MLQTRVGLCLGFALVAALCVLVPNDEARAQTPDPPAASGTPIPTTPNAVTHHVVTVAGHALHYTATAGRLTLRNSNDQPIASMFSVAYTLDGTTRATRPVAFVWNGGPGSSTIWLHMASFGPMRVDISGTGGIVPPGKLIVNDETLLASTDLVFIDAPGTGYSRVVGKGTKDDVYGVDQDARAFSQFIQLWLSAFDRWGSPKFLIGESYGTTRAANVVNRLQEDGVGVNGVVLIGSALDLTALDSALPGDDRSVIAFLPTEAAVAWYHDALPSPRPPQLEPLLAEVRAFALGPYASALLQGDKLDAARRTEIIASLHRYTGLDASYIDRANLRIDPTRFEKELLRETGKVTGRYDARFEGDDPDRNADSPSYDPTLDATIQDAIIGQFNRYVRDDLRFRDDMSYKPGSSDATQAWKLERDVTDSPGNEWRPNVLPDLAQALTRSPSLRVFSANGWYDLATPFFGTEIGLFHLGLPPSLEAHIALGYYPSGHMIYLDPASRAKLRGDIAAFIHAATAEGP